MASKGLRRAKRHKTNLNNNRTKPQEDTAKFLIQMENIAKATRNAERKRKLLEAKNGTTE